VERTTAGRQLPVYTDYKNGRSRTLTLVRKVSGDVPFLVEELRRVTGGAAVAAKLGRVEIEGDRAKEVRAWLAGLGF
jgi:large subunit ribosomal protein L49